VKKDTLSSMGACTLSVRAFSMGFYNRKSNDGNTSYIPQGMYHQQGTSKKTLQANELVCSPGVNVTSSVKETKTFTGLLYPVQKAQSLYEQSPATAYLSSEWSLAYSNTINNNKTDIRGFGPVTGSFKHDLCFDSSYSAGDVSVPAADSFISPGLLSLIPVYKKIRGCLLSSNP